MRTLRRMTWVEVKLLVREPLTVVFTFGFPFLVLVVLGQVFGNAPDPEAPEVWRGVGPMDYYLHGYIGLSIAAIGLIALPVHLASYREQGVLRRFRASGIGASIVVGAQAIVAASASVAGCRTRGSGSGRTGRGSGSSRGSRSRPRSSRSARSAGSDPNDRVPRQQGPRTLPPRPDPWPDGCLDVPAAPRG